MSLLGNFDIAGSALSAQTVRLNTVASNLANAETVSGSAEDTYRARMPQFETIFNDAMTGSGDSASMGVQVRQVLESEAAPRQQYQPEHPMADEQGYIWLPNVNAVEEMANMISASRSYQSNVEVMNTSKQLLMRVLSLGQ
ncbi:flagellar basal body rod protein FlgC [Sulfuriflexus sp.]|uniref:flagellar basal body rod protein FlgC n=1 Tax=Sulfuriflexus sp. TaxID=2015443 RepID=UPI0028CDD64F|nr:flagellar basal body rod protein FlgC [Sulfuriflexus sp.]MDT8404491.1 flagellar basal body rod protein FlgC [Sulfuriflexus sp.]